tara:strand:+ start:32858 stop:33238 length:381 start_codon:yes stop_codon:yes gene_type:complete
MIILIALTTLTNCTDNNEQSSFQEEVNADSKNLTFETFEEYQKQLNNLKLLEQSKLEQWITENNPNSLYSYIQKHEDYIRKLPNHYKAIFNENFEINLDNQILWLDFKSGNLYTFSGTIDLNLQKK